MNSTTLTLNRWYVLLRGLWLHCGGAVSTITMSAPLSAAAPSIRVKWRVCVDTTVGVSSSRASLHVVALPCEQYPKRQRFFGLGCCDCKMNGERVLTYAAFVTVKTDSFIRYSPISYVILMKDQ